LKKSADEIALRLPIYFSFSRAAASSSAEDWLAYMLVGFTDEAISKGSLTRMSYLSSISISLLVLYSTGAAG